MSGIEGAASVLTILHLAWNLSIRFKKLIADIKRQDEEVQQLEEKAETLAAIIAEVEKAYGPPDGHAPATAGDNNIRSLVRDATTRCKEDLEAFETELEALTQKRRGLGGSVLRRWRQQVAAPTFARIEKSVEGHQFSLQLLIQILHGRNLDTTRQVMGQGFAAVLASNRKMLGVLQGLADDPQSLTRQDTETTLVQPVDEHDAGDRTATADENEAMLHNFFEGLYAVWLKSAGSEGTPAKSQEINHDSEDHTQSAGSPPKKAATTRFGNFTMNNERPRKESSPPLGPTDDDATNLLQPITSSSSNTSSPLSMSSATTGPSMSSQEHDTQSSSNNTQEVRSKCGAGTCIELDLEGCVLQDRKKGTELLKCVQDGDIQAIKSLIDNGASLDVTDKSSKTALLIAAHHGKVDAVRILLDKGADLQAVDNKEQTALHLALRRPSAHGVIPSLLGLDNQQTGLSDSCKELINACDKDWRTPLHDCARLGMIEPAKTLLTHGADVNAQDSSGLPPAYFAMKHRKYEIVELLIENEKADFSTFQWPTPDEMGREITNLLEERGWTRPPPSSDSSSIGRQKSKGENTRPSRSLSNRIRQASRV